MTMTFVRSKAEWLWNRLKSLPVYLRYAILVPLVTGLFSLQLLTLFGHQSPIDQKMVFPYLFNIREKINPRKIDPRIKIFALDDQSYGYLKSDDISLVEWAHLFRDIAKTPNVSIFIDKLFSKYYTDQEVAEFDAIMSESKPNISIIAFSYPDQIRFRTPIPETIIAEKMEKFVKVGPGFLKNLGDSNHALYGTEPRILKNIRKLGHAEYPGNGYVRAIRRIHPDHVVPFAGLTAANRIDIDEDKVLVDGKDIHMDPAGEIVVNFAPKAAFSKNSYALMGAVARMRKGMDLNILNPGDVVVILPAMFTGNTDFKPTPFGSMPGGLILSAVIDSVLSKRWTNYVIDPGFLSLLPGLLMFIGGCFISPSVAAIFTFLLAAIVLIVSTVSFVFFDVIISFVFPMAGIILGGISSVILSAAANEAEERRIKREVEIATLVQKSFLRNGTFTLGNSIVVNGISHSASECGGDWWGAFHRFGYSYVMIGDAVGHGVPAALVTAVGFSVTRMIQEELGLSMPPSIDPAGILKRINTILCDMGTDSAFMTFQVMRINDTTGECLYSNAGNSHPILVPASSKDDRLHSESRYKTLVVPGEPLGASSDIDYQNHKITLRPGDHVLMYTDGLIENSPEKDKNLNGRAWLKRTLNDIKSDKNADLHEEFWEAYQKRVGKLPPIDDSTLVTFFRRLEDLPPVGILFEEPSGT